MKKILIALILAALIGCQKEPKEIIIKDKWQIEVISLSQTPITYRANNTSRQIDGIFSQEIIADTDLKMGVTILQGKPNDEFVLTIKYNDSIVDFRTTSIYFNTLKKPN